MSNSYRLAGAKTSPSTSTGVTGTFNIIFGIRVPPFTNSILNSVYPFEFAGETTYGWNASAYPELASSRLVKETPAVNCTMVTIASVPALTFENLYFDPTCKLVPESKTGFLKL